MKIYKYGVVILTEGSPRVEDWVIEREPDDPADATEEQLLLGFAIHWAKGRFDAAINSAAMDVFRKQAQCKQIPVSGGAPPHCNRHNEQMVLTVFDRPLSPPGNNWMCRSCAAERGN